MKPQQEIKSKVTKGDILVTLANEEIILIHGKFGNGGYTAELISPFECDRGNTHKIYLPKDMLYLTIKIGKL